MPLFHVLDSFDRDLELYSHESEYHTYDVHKNTRLKGKSPFGGESIVKIFEKQYFPIFPLVKGG
jgi:hypothetical protein